MELTINLKGVNRIFKFFKNGFSAFGNHNNACCNLQIGITVIKIEGFHLVFFRGKIVHLVKKSEVSTQR